jgi:hypothetical protein
MITATVDHVQDPGSTGLPELTIKALRKFFLGARVSVTPGADIQIVQPLGAPSGSLPPRPAPRQARRRDGIPALRLFRPAAGQHSACAINVAIKGGQPRLTTAACDLAWLLIEACNGAVGAAFQAGHAGAIPVARSRACTSRNDVPFPGQENGARRWDLFGAVNTRGQLISWWRRRLVPRPGSAVWRPGRTRVAPR